jgi:4-hydroxy-tetrahydrodipicolinate reductase
MSESTRLAVNGAGGRMGLALARVIAGRDDASIVAALVRPGSPLEDQSSGISTAPRFESVLPAATSFDVLVDFSGSSGFDHALAIARERAVAFLSGSTGLSAAQMLALDDAARQIPVLWAANFSLGVAVLSHLVAEAARLLADWDCEIIEAHHRHKLDAPSGTALMLGRRVAEARGGVHAEPRLERRGERLAGEIGYAVSRGGDIVGEHEVRLSGHGERLELIHRASNRDVFAQGALAAACWLAGRAPGSYTMADTLGLGQS